MYAGNGIVAGSDPDAELGETQLKLQALLAALVRPVTVGRSARRRRRPAGLAMRR